MQNGLNNILFALPEEGALNSTLNQAVGLNGQGKSVDASSFLALLTQYAEQLDTEGRANLLQQLEAIDGKELPQILPLLNLNSTEDGLNLQGLDLQAEGEQELNPLLAQLLQEAISQQQQQLQQNKATTAQAVDPTLATTTGATAADEAQLAQLDSLVKQKLNELLQDNENQADGELAKIERQLDHKLSNLYTKQDNVLQQAGLSIKDKVMMSKSNQDAQALQMNAMPTTDVKTNVSAKGKDSALEGLLSDGGLSRSKLEIASQQAQSNNTGNSSLTGQQGNSQLQFGNFNVGEGKFQKVMAEQLSIAAKPDEAAFGDEMNDTIMWMVNKNVQNAQIKINPAQLGPIEVKLSMNNDTANIQFTTHHASVKDALEQAMPRLREMFSDSGLNLANANVSDQSQQQQQGQRFADAQQQQQQHNARQGQGNSSFGTEHSFSQAEDDITHSLISTKIKANSALVDYYA